MGNWYNEETEKTEIQICKLLNNCGVKTKRNNIKKITDVDLMTEDGIKIDVQFSKSLDNYNSVIIDFISAFDLNSKGNSSNKDIFAKFENKYGKIQKKGKYFNDGYVDFVIIKDSITNTVAILDKNEVIEYINTIDIKNVRINNKSKYNLTDSWGSAFVPLNLKELNSNYIFKNSLVIRSGDKNIKDKVKNAINKR